MFGLILFIFGIQEYSIINQYLVNVKVPAPKIGAFQRGPKHIMAIF
jgi:hypothetical protein